MTVPHDRSLDELQLAYFAYKPDEDRLVLRSCSWPNVAPQNATLASSDQVRFSMGLEAEMICQASKTGTSIHIPDTWADDRRVEESEMRSIYVVPVSTVGPCDVLVLASREVDGITKRERALAHVLVRHVAQPSRLAAQREAQCARLERGLQRIRLEVAQLGIDGDSLGEAVPNGMADRLRMLSPREWQVMERLRSGRRVVTIASELTISPNTVRNHLKSIYRKLGVRSQVELLERMRGADPGVHAMM
jgi:DNA-binding CsgD family transcriptional regulator